MAVKRNAKSGAAKGAKRAAESGAENTARLQVVYWPIESLIPYARNARQHPESQISALAGSIKEFGFNQPVLVDGDSGIVAGHGRVLAAKKLGLTEVPCIELGHLSDTAKRAYVLADNKLAEGGKWDKEMLSLEVADLKDLGVELGDVVGFGSAELTRLLDHNARNDGDEATEDEAPERVADAITRPGDQWRLGDHRLRCGDATNPADVAALLSGVEPIVMVTDPPYGVNYDPAWRNNVGTGRGARGAVANDGEASWREVFDLFKGPVAYVWHAGSQSSVVHRDLIDSGFEIRAQIIWAKPRPVISRGHYHHQHEPCWYAVRKDGQAHWAGDRSQSTVWQIGNSRDKDAAGENARTNHGTQKPVECMRRPIVNHTTHGQAVYDPFMGSGTTVIAAEQVKRVCYGMEIDRGYVDVAIARWEAFTGKQATLEASGQTFAEVAAERRKEAA